MCFYFEGTIPVFAVRLQVRDQVTRARLHRDGLLLQGDDVGSDLRPVTVRLLPLQVEAGGRGHARLRGGREVQEGEGGDRVRVGGRGAEIHLLAVGSGAGLVHRLETATRGRRVSFSPNVTRQERVAREAFKKRNSRSKHHSSF